MLVLYKYIHSISKHIHKAFKPTHRDLQLRRQSAHPSAPHIHIKDLHPALNTLSRKQIKKYKNPPKPAKTKGLYIHRFQNTIRCIQENLSVFSAHTQPITSHRHITNFASTACNNHPSAIAPDFLSAKITHQAQHSRQRPCLRNSLHSQ